MSLTTLVSKAAGAEVQGSAFGLTQGGGSLGRTVGPPVVAALYVIAFWTPFVVGGGCWWGRWRFSSVDYGVRPGRSGSSKPTYSSTSSASMSAKRPS